VKRFNTPPGWPEPPPGWLPDANFVPDPSWPPLPEGWQLVVDDEQPGGGRLRSLANRVVTHEAVDDAEAIWSAQSQTIASAATGGKAVKGRYRLTHEMLYFERGTLRTDAQQVPIVHVLDVDVKQSMTQKARSVGDVIVHIQRPDRVELVRMESIPQPREAQAIINKTARQARHEAQRRQNTMRYETTHGSAPPPASTSAAAAPSGVAGSDAVSQLKQLAEIRDAGILSDDEFESKKRQILERM
jgi:hypothetical protein